MVRNSEYVLVSAPAQIDEDDAVRRHLRRYAADGGNRVAGLQRRNDALGPTQQLKW